MSHLMTSTRIIMTTNLTLSIDGSCGECGHDLESHAIRWAASPPYIQCVICDCYSEGMVEVEQNAAKI